MTSDPKRNQPVIVWWIVWSALMAGIFVIYSMINVPAKPVESPSVSPESSVWMVGFAPFVVSTIIRWLVLPRVQVAQSAFAVFIVGMAIAEVSCILGVVVFPAHKLELFVLSVLGIGQFAPYFASRFVTAER